MASRVGTLHTHDKTRDEWQKHFSVLEGVLKRLGVVYVLAREVGERLGDVDVDVADADGVVADEEVEREGTTPVVAAAAEGEVATNPPFTYHHRSEHTPPSVAVDVDGGGKPTMNAEDTTAWIESLFPTPPAPPAMPIPPPVGVYCRPYTVPPPHPHHHRPPHSQVYYPPPYGYIHYQPQQQQGTYITAAAGWNGGYIPAQASVGVGQVQGQGSAGVYGGGVSGM
ncbi:hypothetical protein HK104_003324 [Borealophlyctis nickersoniae]|nr:hypothetical protein HK104_003324 [Borealophlyctis nickersoniae]